MKITADETYHKIWEFVRNTNRMPTVRELADFCGVHFMTISRKIKQLKKDGRIITKPKAGIYFPPPESKIKLEPRESRPTTDDTYRECN